MIFSKPVTEQAEAFTDFLTEAFHQFVPVRKVTIKYNDQPWLNS